jgi:hypothetical protein
LVGERPSLWFDAFQRTKTVENVFRRVHEHGSVNSSTDEARVTLDICLRSAVAGITEARQEEVLDRVHQLKRNGSIDEISVNYWGGRVAAPNDGTRNDSGTPDIVTELYDVIDDSTLSLEPVFREKTGDRDRTVLFLPVVCLVVRRDDEVVGVYPSTCEDDHETLQDGLAALAGGDEWANVA